MGDRDLGPRFNVEPAVASPRAKVREWFNGRYMVIYDSGNVSSDFGGRERALEVCIEGNKLGDQVQIHKGAFPALGLSLIHAGKEAAQRLIEVCSPPIKALMPDQRIYDPDRPHALVDQRPKQDIF